MSNSIEILCDARCIVGEGPIYDERKRCLYMVDIQGKRLRKIDWSSGAVSDTVLPQETGLLLLTEGGELLGGAEDGVYQIDEKGGFHPFSKAFRLKGTRFNDGKVGPDGKAYLGTFSRDGSAAFYRMDCDGTLTELFDGVGNSNGLAWSADGSRFYYNDTPTGRTDVFTYDQKNGRLFDRRTVIEYTCGNPDGMTIDTEGNLWTALWGGGCVVCVDPLRGEIIRKIDLPVSQVACCAFAGEDMKTLVITTAAHGIMLKDEPLAGAVFGVQVDVSGQKSNRMLVVPNAEKGARSCD